MYKTKIDMWSQEARNHVKDKGGEDKRRYEQESSKTHTNPRQYRDKQDSKNAEKRSQQNEYKNYQYEEQKALSRRKGDVEHRRDSSSKSKDADEVYSEDDIQTEDMENYERGVDYQRKKFYEENVEGEMKFDNEKSSSNPTSDSDDDSTIPEAGRKVEHIAQKLEQTAQKYAREHTSPKFMERNARQEFKSPERAREEKPPPYDKYDKFEERERERAISQQRYERERDRYYEKQNHGNQSYERTFEKNPDRNRNGGQRGSSRRFERPRPPSEEAPERPNTAVYQNTRQFSDKEDVYGESGFERSMEKDRGYESNFETKLERTKVIERHREAYQKLKDQKLKKPEKEENGFMDGSMKNDSNNNTLNSYNRKMGLPRQSTAVSHMMQTGRQLDLELKGPKIVKRTKSFWKFRKDSDVLEGMALWQHRSLVDIPTTLKREEKVKSKERSRKQRDDTSPDSRNSDGHHSDTTITNDPTPAERMNVRDKADDFEDFPTPAERSKIIERPEYRAQHHPEQERPYFVGNISRKAIIEKERKRSLEAKRNMIVAELKENGKPNNRGEERRKKAYGEDEDDDGLIQNFTETEASDEESTYSCIVIKDQAVTDNKPFLPRTKLRRDSDRERDRNTCGPWYDLWGADASVAKKKPKKQKQL